MITKTNSHMLQMWKNYITQKPLVVPVTYGTPESSDDWILSDNYRRLNIATFPERYLILLTPLNSYQACHPPSRFLLDIIIPVTDYVKISVHFVETSRNAPIHNIWMFWAHLSRFPLMRLYGGLKNIRIRSLFILLDREYMCPWWICWHSVYK